MSDESENALEQVVQTFHSFQHIVMEQVGAYIWGQPESVGRLSVISAAAAFEHLAKELRAAGEHDLHIRPEVFDSAVQVCSDHRLRFDLAVKPPAEILAERKARMH